MLNDIHQIIDLIKQYNPNANFVMLEKAFEKCKEWHGEQKRKSGDPYWTHPFAVAKEIINMQLDDATIITALLHDVLEDTHIKFEDIEREFSTEIAELVNGVTKLDKLNFQLDKIKQAENFRKLFLALAKDIRVLVVKLCDRLHNMQTIGHKTGNSVKRISVETLEIYAPLAERIGMRDIARELQDLAFGSINSRARNSVVRRLDQIKSKSEDGNLVKDVANELTNLLSQNNIKCTVNGREKTPYSIWKKLIKKGTTFEKLIDIVGFRIITENQQDCYAAFGVIHSKYKAIPNTFSDYISLPKSNGYKSIHTVVIGPFLQRIEIQIRTKAMDVESEYGLAAHWSYKQSVSKPAEIKQGMELWIKMMLDILSGTNNAQEFLETTKLEMYTDQIFAFTPDGDIIDLPNGATVLDFAFAVHSDIGCICNGAKINNTQVGIDYKIKNGDQVKILTSKAVWPTIEWLKIVKTGRAKYEIKKATREEQIANIRAKGMEILTKLFTKYNHKVDDKIIDKLINHTGSHNANSLYSDIANNVIDIVTIVKQVFPDFLYISNAFLDINSFDGIDENKNIINKVVLKEEPWIKKYNIKGLPECFSHQLSYCCKPNINDYVIGISIPNEAIFIHKINCENILHCYLGNNTIIDNLYIEK